MGIHCEMNLFNPPDGTFVPGETVSGVIKYAVDRDTAVKRIIVSLKGGGVLRIRNTQRRQQNRPNVFYCFEEYVDIDNIIREDEKGILPFGCYETNFSFTVPKNLPPSFKYMKHLPHHIVKCKISYFVRIKFEKPGLFKLNKHFRYYITMLSGVTPNLPTVPTVFSKDKNLCRLISSSPRTVKIRANVESCVLAPGTKIELNYEVHNNTNLVIKSVETKLIEVHSFKARSNRKIQNFKDVPDTDTKTASINSGDHQTMLIIMNLPPDIMSLENSKIVQREYAVKITVDLPMPHFNIVFEIPVQIGYRTDLIEESAAIPINELPPPYWAIMGEANGSREDLDSIDNF